MVEYTPEEVDMLIKILKKIKPRGERIEKTIRYLEQRHKFFNPTKDMLTYIINYVSKSKLNPELLLKMKNDLASKQ